jgi:uncharacterized protein YjbJ (UPF0337 family)
LKNEFENLQQQMLGQAKQVTGKFTNDKELEFKGKVQSLKANLGSKVDDVKDGVYEKANDFLDEVKKKME